MIIIGDNLLTQQEFDRAVLGKERIEVSPKAVDKMTQSFLFLKNNYHGKVIYGINTGFGPMAQYKIDELDQVALQYNLIRSHSAGSGKLMDPELVRGAMLARLNSMVRGYSGIHPLAATILVDMLNADICPHIYEHGGVGASGDLVQLSHLALGMIGEGIATYKGENIPIAQAFQQENITPLQVHIREGLSIINGTSVMTGIGMINLSHAKNLQNYALICAAMILEIVQAFDDCISVGLNKVKMHNGQRTIATRLRNILRESDLIKSRRTFNFDERKQENRFADKVQEYYSIRCLPQILGPVYETLQQCNLIVEAELNSVSDNPVIDVEQEDIFHGGNFHGDYVSMEMDKLKVAIVRLSMLGERQLNFLMNDTLNQVLPPFVNLGKLGVNLGMQGAQFVATSTVAENQTLAYPMALHSISCNKDNQDIVSMGTNAALLTNKVINNTYEVFSILAITIIQAIDKLKYQDRLSPITREYYQAWRSLVPVFKEDLPLYEPIRRVKESMVSQFVDDNIFDLKSVTSTLS